MYTITLQCTYFDITGRVKERKRRDEDSVDQFVEGKLSKSIIQQARLQAAELETEIGAGSKKFKETKLTIEVSYPILYYER